MTWRLSTSFPSYTGMSSAAHASLACFPNSIPSVSSGSLAVLSTSSTSGSHSSASVSASGMALL